MGKKERRIRRILLWTLVSSIILLLVVHIPPVQNLITKVITSIATRKLEGRLEIGHASYSLWKGKATLEAVTYEGPGIQVRVDRVDASFFTGNGVSLRIMKPELIYEHDPERAAPKKEASPPVWMLLSHIGSADVEKGRLELVYEAFDVEFAGSLKLMRGVGAGLSPERIWSVRGDIGCRVAEFDPISLEVKATAGLQGTRLRFDEANISAGRSTISAKGVLFQSYPFAGNLSGDFLIEDSLLQAFPSAVPVQGEASGRFQLDIKAPEVSGRVESEAPRIMLADTGPWDLRAEADFSREEIDLDSLVLEGYGGSIETRGEVNLLRREVRANMKAQNIEIDSLVSHWKELPFPLATRFGSDVELSLNNWEIDQAEAQGVVRFDPLQVEGLPVSGRVDFELGKGALSFDSQGFQINETQLAFSGRMNRDDLETRYELRLPASDLVYFSQILKVPVPDLHAEGYLAASGRIAGQIANVSLSAQVLSEDLKVLANDYRVTADIEATRDRFEIKEAEILSDPGKIHLKGNIPFGISPSGWDLSAELESVELSDLVAKLGYGISMDGGLTVKGAAKAPTWQADLKSRIFVREQTPPAGTLSLRAKGQGNELKLDEFKLDLSGGSLEATGQYQIDTRSARGQMKGDGFRLEEIPLLAQKWPGLEGNVSLDANIQGPISLPELELNLNLSRLVFEEASLPDLTFRAETQENKIEFQGFAGESFLSGGCELDGAYPLQLEIDLAALPINEILGGFPDLSQLDITSAKGRIRMDVSLRSPDDLRYQAEVESVAGAYASKDWSISAFNVRGNRESLLIEDFHLSDVGNFIQINGRIPFVPEGDVDIQVNGDLDLAAISSVLPNTEIVGQVNTDIHVVGTRAAPRVLADASIKDCRGNWKDLSWENLELQLTGEENGFLLNMLSIELLEGNLSANGHLFWTESGLDSKCSFSLDRLNLASLLADSGLTQASVVRLSGTGEITASDLSLPGISGTGSFSNIEAGLEGVTISLQSPAEWSLDGGKVSLSPVRFVGDNTDITVSLAYDPQKALPDWNVSIQGILNAELANHFIQDNNVRFSGHTEIKIDAKRLDGRLDGQASINGGRINLRNPAVSVTKLELQASLREQYIEISKMQGEVGTGLFQISGRITSDDTGKLKDVDLQIKADNVPLSLSDGITSQVFADTRLSGSGREYTLSGSVVLPRVLFRQELETGSDSLVYIERQLKSLEEEPSLLDLISLDLKAEIQDLRIENSMANLSAEGIFSIRGNLTLPELNGSMQLKSGGTIYIGRALVRIEEGRVSLEDYPNRPLDVSISGVSRIRGTFIELSVKGSADNLQTQIYAPDRPDLTQGDLATMLMTGRTSAAAVSEAGAVVTEELAAGLGGLLQQRVGEKVYIDISTGDADFSYESDPTTRFSLGHQVAPYLYVIYSTALNGTQSRGLLDFRPPQPFRLRYMIEEDGRRIVGASHTFGFRLRGKASTGLSGDEGQARIQEIVFEGESPLELEEQRKLSKLKPGKKYKYWEALQGAERIRSRLVKQGYRSALVDVEESPVSSGQVALTFLIDKGKRTQLIWEGDPVGKSIRKKVEDAWDGRMSEEMQAETLAQQTVYFLQAKKFYQARVTPSVSSTETDVTVNFQVSKGPKGRRVVLTFEGNESLPSDRLAAALPKTTKPEFFALLERDKNMLRRTIHVLYASEGFLEGRIESIQTDFENASKELHVAVHVDEGPRALIASVNLPPEAEETFGPGEAEFKLKADLPFRLDDYISDKSRLDSFYREQGYSHPQVSGMLKPSDDKIAVFFSVAKGPKTRVGEVRLGRPGRTRLSAVENALTLKQGDQILPEELALSRKRLYDTRAFQSVDIQAVPSEEGEEVRDLVVELVDKPEVQVNYGVRYVLHNPTLIEDPDSGEFSPFEFGGGLQFLNPFGFTHRYGASGYFFGKDQFYRLFFESETFFGLRFPTQVILSQDWLRELQVSGFKSRINRITFQQHYLWGEGYGGDIWRDRLRLQWNYSFRHIRLTPLDDLQTPLKTDRGSISLSLIGDTRDSFVNAEKGLFWSVSSEFARTWLGSDVNFVKLFAQAYLYVPLREKVIWASGLRLGAVPGENPFLIIEDRFTAGGVYSVRGFPQFYLGPKNERGEPLGGQAVVIFNQELRFPLYKSFHGGIFYDTGNVFALAKQMSIKGLRHNVGLGLRYVLPFGPIRFDWAYVLDPKPGEKRHRFMFTIGHVF